MRLLSLALALICSVSGTTLQKLSLDEMIQQSTGVVRAKVTGSYSAFRGADIYTFYQLQVVEDLKTSNAGQLEVAVPGGSARGVRQSVAGAPALTIGDEYVFFLWTSRSGLTQVIGLAQGLYSVKPDIAGNLVMIRPASGETMLDRSGRVVVDQPVNLPLSDVRVRVRQALMAVK